MKWENFISFGKTEIIFNCGDIICSWKTDYYYVQ